MFEYISQFAKKRDFYTDGMDILYNLFYSGDWEKLHRMKC